MISKVLQSFNKILLDYDIPKKGIIQVGAFDGEEIPSYIEMGFKSIILIEANPGNIPSLQAKAKPYEKDYDIKIFHVAITNYDGVIKFNIAERADCGSVKNYTGLTTIFGVTAVDIIIVPCSTLDSLFKDNNLLLIDYNILNMDIEGEELNALLGATELLENIDVIYSEIRFTDLFENGTMCKELEEFLFARKYKKVFYKKWHETFGDAIYIKGDSTI